MKFYLSLQCKRLHRHLKDFGIEPVIGYLAIPGLFFWLSNSFFEKVMYANYFYMLIAANSIFFLGFLTHDNFIKQHFSVIKYRKIMLFTHLIRAIPFCLFLIYKNYYFEAAVLSLLSVLFSFVKKPESFSWVIPTPFYKWPYEFTAGFRKTFWAHLLSYGIVIIAVQVENFNLGVFAIVLVFLVCSGYYTKNDPQFYIWIHDMDAREFLKHKIKIAIFYSVMLSMPVVLMLSLFYPDQIHFVMMFEILGILYVTMYVLMKYAFDRQGVGILQGIIGVLCLLFPPALFIVVPYFYVKAKNNLKTVLT